jgi:hypothetical protein
LLTDKQVITNRSILTLGILLVLLSGWQSCKKDTLLVIDIGSLAECTRSQHFDSTKLAAKLMGSWRWMETSSESGPGKADKDIKVTFTSAGKFTLTENSTILSRGSWQLKNDDSGGFELETDHLGSMLYGHILLCEDKLLFNDSYRDGFDNLFTRSE